MGRISIIAIFVVFFGLIGLVGFGLGAREPLTGASGVARVGRPAIDFALNLFDGGTLSLSGLRGKPVVVNFWASWCPPCREEAATLEKTWRAYKDKGVVFVGVDIQDTEAAARAYIEEFHVTYPNGPDRDGKITIDYGVSGIPITFFINREGQIVNRWVGAITEPLLVAQVEALLK